MARFAAALSEHPDPASAIGEAVGQVHEALDPADGRPDLALLFVTPPFSGALRDMAATVRATVRPDVLVGCAAVSIVGGTREVEQAPAVSLWAGHTGPVTAFQASDPGAVPDLPDGASALLLLPDPFTFPVDDFLRRVNAEHPGLAVVGGMASAARGPGGNRLVLDGQVFTSGAVGAYLGPNVAVATVVSQGCRPVGSPFVITRADRNIVYELAGKPALERLQEVAMRLPDSDRELLSAFVHMGRVIDEKKVQFGRGDFLVRNVLGADPDNGAMAVNDIVEVGSTAQFQVRDAESADDDLRQLLQGASADAALLFTCNGRGTHLFDEPDHDARVLSECLGSAPVAGMFCAGELGPIGGSNFVHGFTASVVLLSAGGTEPPNGEERS